MKSSLQTPKPLPKSRSRDHPTPTFASVPSHLKTSDLSLSAIPRHQKIRAKSLDTDFLAASEHTLSDLPDPVMICGEPRSNLSTVSKSSDSNVSDITVEQKLLSNSECLAGPEVTSSDLPHLTMSSARSLTSEYSAQQGQHLLVPKVHGENAYKGKPDVVISASDLIKRALVEINQSKDITDETKKIMDAMFEAAVQQLKGVDSGKRAVRLSESDLMAKLRIALLLLVILFLAVRLLLKICFVDAEDWTYGLTPT